MASECERTEDYCTCETCSNPTCECYCHAVDAFEEMSFEKMTSTRGKDRWEK